MHKIRVIVSTEFRCFYYLEGLSIEMHGMRISDIRIIFSIFDSVHIIDINVAFEYAQILIGPRQYSGNVRLVQLFRVGF